MQASYFLKQYVIARNVRGKAIQELQRYSLSLLDRHGFVSTSYGYAVANRPCKANESSLVFY